MTDTKVYTMNMNNLVKFGIQPGSQEAVLVAGLTDIMNSRYELGAKHSREGYRAFTHDEFMPDLEDKSLRLIFYRAYRRGYTDTETATVAAEYPAAHKLYEKAKDVDTGNYGVGINVFCYICSRFSDDRFFMLFSAFKIGFLKGQRSEKARLKKARAGK